MFINYRETGVPDSGSTWDTCATLVGLSGISTGLLSRVFQTPTKEILIPENEARTHGALFRTILGWKRSQISVINVGVHEVKYG